MNIKKIVIIGMLAVGAYQLTFTERKMSVSSNALEPAASFVHETISNQNFTCDGRQYCSQMTSYQEAVFFLKHCPNTKMDGDHDGEPCERQF